MDERNDPARTHDDRDQRVVEGEVLDGDILDDDEPETRLRSALTASIEAVRAVVVADVQRVRDRNPELSPDDLARLVVKRGTRRVGWTSFATGFGGLATAAVNVPSVLVMQTGLVLSVAEVYGELDSPDVRQDIALILAGEGAAGALRAFGVAATNDFSKRWVGRNVTRETMKKVNRIVSRKILTKAGERSLTSFTKLVPVVGASVGYAFDRGYARVLGERAIRYYGGR